MNEQTDTPIPYQPIDDVNELASKLIQWHDTRVARVRHMMTIPEGTGVDFEEDGQVVLSGAVLKAYRLGIQVALHELGELPFTAEYETDD